MTDDAATSTALGRYVAKHGSTLRLGRREFTVERFFGDGELALATFRAAKATYTGVLGVRSRVIGRPQAEHWTILSNATKPRTVASFAVEGDDLFEVS